MTQTPIRPETFKIAYIETMVGPLAATGNNLLRTYQMMCETSNRENWTGAGHTLEVTPFENKGSPQEALAQLQVAIDQGYQYIAQGTNSLIAAALLEAIDKHSWSRPGKEVVFLNHAAVDPALTNEKCSFWHFRFDAHTDMKMEAISGVIEKDPSIKRVYIIGQDYSFGHQVSRATREFLKRKRPDIEIVGDDYHPIAQLKDFSPFVAKMKEAKADAIVTGNWGVDLALLLRAAHAADLSAAFFTFYGGMSSGVMKSVMSAGDCERMAGRVKQVGNWTPNLKDFAGKEIQVAFRQRYNEDFYATPVVNIVTMLSAALRKANSVDPLHVALALETTKIVGMAGGPVEMRAVDHQLQQAQIVSTWAKVNGADVKYDQEDTGYGWQTEAVVPADVISKPATGQMRRPVGH